MGVTVAAGDGSGLPGFLWGAGAVLCCPVTGDDLVFVAAVSQPLPGRGFGVLNGGAGPYPVVDGVPVLQHGRVGVLDHVSGAQEAPGPDVAALVSMVESGDSLGALLALLAVVPSPRWRGRHVPGSGRLLGVPALGRLGVRVRRAQLRTRLGHGRRDGTLEWWTELFHTRSQGINDELVHYFRHRRTQPRYLAALAATRAVAATAGVVLDLACGYGHLSADLAAGADEGTGDGVVAPRVVVGVDRTFFQVWLATHFVAPGAVFVCADASTRLPLASGGVDAVVCSDAFHYLPGQEVVLTELLRVCSAGPVVLTRVGNVDHEPHEGLERTATGWAGLVADRHAVLVEEDQLVGHYLHATPVTASDPAVCAAGKWLSLLLSGEPDTDLTPGPPVRRAHERGHMHLNPLYAQHPRAGGGMDVELVMPSHWYRFENDALRSYHAPTATLGPEVLAALHHQQRTPEVQALIGSFVIIGDGVDAPG